MSSTRIVFGWGEDLGWLPGGVCSKVGDIETSSGVTEVRSGEREKGGEVWDLSAVRLL